VDPDCFSCQEVFSIQPRSRQSLASRLRLVPLEQPL
jgi:hypothetical protein